MKSFNVYAMTPTGPALISCPSGEAMLDTSEGVLIFHGENMQTSYTFNWDNILGYTEYDDESADE